LLRNDDRTRKKIILIKRCSKGKSK